MITAVDIETIELSVGCHQTPYDGMCAMEAVSSIHGEPFTDRPERVCPVLAVFTRRWNDDLSDHNRTRIIRPFLHRFPGTHASPDIEARRSWMAFNWQVHHHLASFVSLVNPRLARSIQSAPAITCDEDVPHALLSRVHQEMNEARRSARARHASVSASSRIVAHTATARAAGDAAWAAATGNTGRAIWAKTEDAVAWHTAHTAAHIAAINASERDGGRATSTTAGHDRIQLTVRRLQHSAAKLLDQMIRLSNHIREFPGGKPDQSTGLAPSCAIIESHGRGYIAHR